MIHSSPPKPWSESPRALSARSSPESPTTALGPVSASPSSSSASSGSTVRRESLPSLASPKSFTVTRHTRKALSVSVAAPGGGTAAAAAASRGCWSPPISSPLASPYGSPPPSPPPERKRSIHKRRRPASPSASTHVPLPCAPATGSKETARPALGPQPSISSPGTAWPSKSSPRSRPAVRRAASASDLDSHEWRLVSGAGDKIGRTRQGSGGRTSSGSRPFPSDGATQEVAAPGAAGAATKSLPPLPPLDSLQHSPSLLASSPTSPTLFPATFSADAFAIKHTAPFVTSGGMQLLPSPSTFKVSSATSPSSRSTFEDYFNSTRSSHCSNFAFPSPLATSGAWYDTVDATAVSSRPAASRSQLTIRIDDPPTVGQASSVALPEHEERSPTTPVALPTVHPASSSSPAPPHTADPRRETLPVPPRLIRKRSSSDPTPVQLSLGRDSNGPNPNFQLGKPLPPLPASTGDQAFRSTSASSCSSSASSTSRITEDTAATCSSLATTTEACDTPSSDALGFDSGEATGKMRRRASKRRARPAVEGSAIDSDSEAEPDGGSVPGPPTLDSPFEERSTESSLASAGSERLSVVGPDARLNSEKASKLACQLWDLVEGEVAYTDDLVTLVQIYLHHLFMLPTFSAERRDVVARNTLDLLVLHKRFTQSLVSIASQEHLRSPDDQAANRYTDTDLDRAARRIARVFVEEADEFAAYQEYCTGHEEALSVIRQHELTFQWMEYERKCSALSQQRPRTSLATLMEQQVSSPPGLGSRRSSFKWHSPTSTPLMTVPPIAAAAATEPERKHSRLMLRDLLIKPIQRICRYPLILDSIRTSKVVDLLSGELRPAGGVDLEQALAVMKVAAGSVDEATRRKISLERSRMIRNRIESHPTLSRGVLSALGECLLVGSLDVIYHHPVQAPISTPIKIRYLSAFLYAGYFVLCKAKKGKSYSALHFLPLERLEISEGQPGKSYLTDSIRLQGEGYFFEVSAACSEEKNIWLARLLTAQASPTLALKSPPSSAPEIFASRTISRRMSQGAPLAARTSLSKRNSGSAATGTSHAADTDTGVQSSPMELYAPPLSVTSTPASSPRTHVAGVTLPMVPNQMLFLRSPSSYRETVDKALADVMTESCSKARNNALRQGVALFAPSAHKTTTSSSTIGAAVSSVRRKMAHQNGSMRRRSFLDVHGQLALTEGSTVTAATADKSAAPTSSANKLPRTKSEVGLKRESFLRRSSLMTHWPVEPRAAPALPPMPANKAPVRAKSDKARSHTAPPTPVMAPLPLRPPPQQNESTETENPCPRSTSPARAVPSLAITPITPSPTKVRTSGKAPLGGPGSMSRRASVVESWFPRNLTVGQRPLSPILSPTSLADKEIAFPRQSIEQEPAAAAPIAIPSRSQRASTLRRSLTSTFTRRRTKSAIEVPDLALSQAKTPAGSAPSDGLTVLSPVSPVSPLELCGEFGAISALDSASDFDPDQQSRAIGASSRPTFFIKSRSSSIASEDSAPDAALASAAMTPSSSVSNSAPSSDDGFDPNEAPLDGPIRRKSSRSVRFLKSFTFTPVT